MPILREANSSVRTALVSAPAAGAVLLALVCALCLPAPALAQTVTPGEAAFEPFLPDAPGMDAGHQAISSVAGRYDKYIDPDQQAPVLTVHDKIVLGFRDAFSPESIAVWALVAGYEQALNNSPNWPRNKAGYFRRAGAAAVRDSTDGIFGDSLFAPLFRQDPRYYRAGRSRSFLYRTLYAVTRPLVTRTDAGHLAPNLSLLAANVFGAWFTDVYYPTINQSFGSTAETFGGSVGSSALGFFVAEFADDFLEAIRLRHRQ